MSEGQIKNHEPSLPPLGLKQHAAEESLPQESASIDASNGKSLGALIRDARTAKGLSPADLAQSLNLDLKIVERLEANQFEGGPEPIYIRAYLKHWAGLVGADPQVWLNAYQLQHGGSVSQNKIGVAAPMEVMTTRKAGHAVHSGKQSKVGRTIGQLALLLVTVAVVLAVIAIALPNVWQKGLSLISGKHEDASLALNGNESNHTVSLSIQSPPAPTPPAQAPNAVTEAPTTNVAPPPMQAPVTPDTTSAPSDNAQATSPTTASTGATEVPAAPATPAEPAAPPVTAESATSTEPTAPAAADANLIIKVNSADCWVEVRDAEGKRVVYDVLKKGEERSVPGSGPFSITLGNPGAVTVLWKGEPVKLGTPNSTTGVIRTMVGGS